MRPPGREARRHLQHALELLLHRPHSAQRRLLLLEDLALAGARQPDNLVIVPHWTGSATDEIMWPLAHLLHGLLRPGAGDVRTQLRQLFGLSVRMPRAGESVGCRALLEAGCSDEELMRSTPSPAGCPVGCSCHCALEHRLLVNMRTRLARDARGRPQRDSASASHAAEPAVKKARTTDEP